MRCRSTTYFHRTSRFYPGCPGISTLFFVCIVLFRCVDFRSSCDGSFLSAEDLACVGVKQEYRRPCFTPASRLYGDLGFNHRLICEHGVFATSLAQLHELEMWCHSDHLLDDRPSSAFTHASRFALRHAMSRTRRIRTNRTSHLSKTVLVCRRNNIQVILPRPLRS